jgi:hypothetical protein
VYHEKSNLSMSKLMRSHTLILTREVFFKVKSVKKTSSQLVSLKFKL